MIRNLTLTALAISLLSSCYYDVESELYPEGCDTPTIVSFSADVLPIIDLNCAISGCHVDGGEGPGLLAEYETVRDYVDSGDLENRVFNSPEDPMPPTGQLGECDLEIILHWINQGALDN